MKTGWIAAFATGTVAVPAMAQIDPVTQGQGMVLMGQNQGHVDRADARRTVRPAPRVAPRTLSPRACDDGWTVYRRMTPAQRAQFDRACVR